MNALVCECILRHYVRVLVHLIIVCFFCFFFTCTHERVCLLAEGALRVAAAACLQGQSILCSRHTQEAVERLRCVKWCRRRCFESQNRKLPLSCLWVMRPTAARSPEQESAGSCCLILKKKSNLFPYDRDHSVFNRKAFSPKLGCCKSAHFSNQSQAAALCEECF